MHLEVQKCLEYYFERNTTKEEIMKYIHKNIEELKKISKIKDAKIDIIKNENEAQKVTLVLVLKRRGIKKPAKEKEQKIKTNKISNYKRENIKMKEKKTKINMQMNQIIQIETEVQTKKYGKYKEGGKFTPFREKKKGKIEIWKNKLGNLNKNQ